MNTNLFRQKQKELLGEITQTGAPPTFLDPQLDSWRNDAVGVLYSKSLYTLASTRGTAETRIEADPVTGVVPQYFELPALWRRVFKVEFVTENEDTFIPVHKYTDLELPGNIRIYDTDAYSTLTGSPSNFGFYLRLFGEKEYSGVDDPFMRQEVVDVVLFDSVIRALIGEYFKRLKASRSQGAGRKTDISPGAIAAGIALLRTLHHDARALALNLQKTNTVSIGV